MTNNSEAASLRGVNPHPSTTEEFAIVPMVIRRKIQFMLLLRHTLGCPLISICEEYKMLYKEDLSHEMFKFKNMYTLLKSMPEEVYTHRRKGQTVVNANPVPQQFAINALLKVFSSSSADVDIDHGRSDAFPSPNGSGDPTWNEIAFVEELVRLPIINEKPKQSEPLNNGLVNGGITSTATAVARTSIKDSVACHPCSSKSSVKQERIDPQGAPCEGTSASLCNISTGTSTVCSLQGVNNIKQERIDFSGDEVTSPTSIIPSQPSKIVTPVMVGSITGNIPGGASRFNDNARNMPATRSVDIKLATATRSPKTERVENAEVCNNSNLLSTHSPNGKISAAKGVERFVEDEEIEIIEEVGPLSELSSISYSERISCTYESSQTLLNGSRPGRTENSSEILLSSNLNFPSVSTSSIGRRTLSHNDSNVPATSSNNHIPRPSLADPSAKTNSAEALPEALQKWVDSLPKCEVKLKRLIVIEDGIEPIFLSTRADRKRKLPESSSVSSEETSGYGLRCSPRLSKTKSPKHLSPIQISEDKTNGTARKRRILPLLQSTSSEAASGSSLAIDKDLDDIQVPRWFHYHTDTTAFGSPEYENFMTYNTELPNDNQDLLRDDDQSFPCGPFFPPDCSFDLQGVFMDIVASKRIDRLKFHTFRSLFPENQPVEEWEISLTEGNVPWMNFESYQIADVDSTLGCEMIESSARNKGHLNFICSYGNFADYFLWKKGNNCYGLGFMPAQGEGFAKLSRGAGISYENFSNFEGTFSSPPDVFDPSSVSDFKKKASSMFPDKVDVMVASAIPYEGLQNRPEDLALVQTLLALDLIRDGGVFILKVSDTQSDFIVGLIFYLSRCFSKISIEKPESALPGERFILCFWKLSVCQFLKIMEFLENCNQFRIQQDWQQTNVTIKSIFGVENLSSSSGSFLKVVDADFMHFIRMNNYDTSKKELALATSIAKRSEKYLSGTQLEKEDIDKEILSMRNNILLKWKLHQITSGDDTSNPTFSKHWPREMTSVLTSIQNRLVDVVNEGNWIKAGEIEQWAFIVSGGIVNRRIIAVTPGEGVSQFKDGIWQVIPGLKLPEGTTLYAELFPASKSRKPILCILDADSIGGRSLRNIPYAQRLADCTNFISKLSTNGYGDQQYSITCATEFPLTRIPTIFERLVQSNGKFSPDYFRTGLEEPSLSKSYTTNINLNVGEILFVKIKTKHEGVMARSGWHASDFRRVVTSAICWEWKNTFKITSEVREKLQDILKDEHSFPLFEYLGNLRPSVN